jgi:type IV pilus assembly protein PilB
VLFEYHTPYQDKLLRAFSDFYQKPTIKLRKKTIVPYVLNLIPKEVAEQHSVIIFKKNKNTINVAITNPENSQTIEFIRKKTGHDPKVFITTPEDIRHAVQKYKSEIRTEFARIIQESIKQTLAINDTAEKIAQYVPIIKMVDTIIERALSQHASDIHFEPGAQKISVRYRIDGLLNKIVEMPIEI